MNNFPQDFTPGFWQSIVDSKLKEQTSKFRKDVFDKLFSTTTLPIKIPITDAYRFDAYRCVEIVANELRQLNWDVSLDHNNYMIVGNKRDTSHWHNCGELSITK